MALILDAHGRHRPAPPAGGGDQREEKETAIWDHVTGSADRASLAKGYSHKANLFNIHMKYGDVWPLADVLKYLSLRAPCAGEAGLAFGAPSVR